MNQSMPTVDDYMSRDLITFAPEDDIHAAVRILLEERISGAPVVDEHGLLVGILSKKDCFKVVYDTAYHQHWGGCVRDYMSPNASTIAAGTDIIAAADQFLHSRFRRFPIIDKGRMVGQISRHDLLRALDDQWGRR